MNLQQINERLDLFPEYLKDILKQPSPIMGFCWIKSRRWGTKEIIRIFQETGNLIIDGKNYTEPKVEYISFDDWLWQKQRYDLCIPEDVTCLKSPYDELVKKSVDNNYEPFGIEAYKGYDPLMKGLFVPKWQLPRTDKWGFTEYNY